MKGENEGVGKMFAEKTRDLNGTSYAVRIRKKTEKVVYGIQPGLDCLVEWKGDERRQLKSKVKEWLEFAPNTVVGGTVKKIYRNDGKREKERK